MVELGELGGLNFHCIFIGGCSPLSLLRPSSGDSIQSSFLDTMVDDITICTQQHQQVSRSCRNEDSFSSSMCGRRRLDNKTWAQIRPIFPVGVCRKEALPLGLLLLFTRESKIVIQYLLLLLILVVVATNTSSSTSSKCWLHQQHTRSITTCPIQVLK